MADDVLTSDRLPVLGIVFAFLGKCDCEGGLLPGILAEQCPEKDDI
jgi:hypothetical protein